MTALLCATKSALIAASILTGSLTLAGAPEIDSRGYGRGSYVRAVDGLFAVACVEGDTTSQPLGSISGGRLQSRRHAQPRPCFRSSFRRARPLRSASHNDDLFDAAPVSLPTLPPQVIVIALRSHNKIHNSAT